MKNNVIFRSLKYFLRNKKAVMFAILMCVCGLVIGVITPIFNKMLQEKIIPDKDIRLFVWITIVVIVLNVANLLSSYFNNKIFIENGVNITAQIRRAMIAKNIGKKDLNVGDFLICSCSFLEETNVFYISYTYSIFDSILKILFYLPFFIFYGGWLSLIMIGMAILSFFVLDIEAKIAKKRATRSRQVDSERYDFVIKMYEEIQKPDFVENDEVNLELYKKKVLACDKAWLDFANTANPYPYVFQFAWYMGFAICAIVAFNLGTLGAITLASFIAFKTYCDSLKDSVTSMVSFKQLADRMDIALTKIYRYVDEEKEGKKQP